MKLHTALLSVALLHQVASFAPLKRPSFAGRAHTTTTPRTKTIRHAGGLEDLVGDQLSSLTNAVSSLPTELQALTTQLSQAMLQLLPAGVDPQAVTDLFHAAANPYHAAAVGVFALASSVMLFINAPDDYSDAPFAAGTDTYDPVKSEQFYRQRPLMVMRRILKLALLTGSFNTGILFDWLVLGKLFKDEEYTALKRNEPRRAKQALVLCEQLGPTFISTYTCTEYLWCMLRLLIDC